MAPKTSKKAAGKKPIKAPKSKTKKPGTPKKSGKPTIGGIPEKKGRIAPPANRPINAKDTELQKLVAWLTAGMKKVRERLDHDIPLMVRDRPASELAHLYGMVRDMNTLVGEALKPLSDAAGILANNLIPKEFENENLTSFTTQDGYRVTVSTAYRASIKADKKEEAYDWLRKNNLDALITETVNAGTLSAAGKKLTEDEGKELPEDLFNAAYMPTTSLTKVAPKK